MEPIRDTGDVNDLPSERDMLRHLANQLLNIASALRGNNGRLGRPLDWAESCEYLNTIAERVIWRETRRAGKCPHCGHNSHLNRYCPAPLINGECQCHREQSA